MKEIFIFKTKYDCPFCGTFDTIRRGQNDRSQYRTCKECGRKFTVIGERKIEIKKQNSQIKELQSESETYFF